MVPFNLGKDSAVADATQHLTVVWEINLTIDISHTLLPLVSKSGHLWLILCSSMFTWLLNTVRGLPPVKRSTPSIPYSSHIKWDYISKGCCTRILGYKWWLCRLFAYPIQSEPWRQGQQCTALCEMLRPYRQLFPARIKKEKTFNYLPTM